MSWQGLVDAALLGTARAAPPEPAPELAHLDDGTLLTRAALLSRARRAGARAFPDSTPAPAPAAPDGRRHLHAAASRRCAGLLDGDDWELLLEWVGLLGASGRRPPPVLVPRLLELGRADPELRELARPVVGELGRWLAAQNPDWQWAAGAAPVADVLDEEQWSTAGAPVRRGLFARARESRPDAARALLAGTWGAETPADRAAFVGLLRIGLTPSDEELLATALRDRSTAVRRAAADLLPLLPDSAFSGRARARAAGVLRVDRTLLRTGVVVEPPTELTGDMKADGLDARPPQGTGPRAHLLRQVVAAVPAAFWRAHTGMALPDLVRRLPREWAGPFVAGLQAAAARDGDGDALDVLFTGDEATRQALLGAVPAAARAGLAVRHRITQPALLQLVPGPWPPELTLGVAARVATRTGWSSRELLWLLGRRGDPDTPVPLPDIPGAAECQALLHERAAARRELLLDPEVDR